MQCSLIDNRTVIIAILYNYLIFRYFFIYCVGNNY